MQKKKKKQWVKRRHAIIRNLASFILSPYIKCKYGIKIEKYKGEKRQYLILANHQTAFDQFFIGMTVRGPIYYVASEDIFTNGFISKLLRFAVAPIPIKKQATDVQAVLNCKRVVREGGTVAIMPEGNRTFSGKTEYFNPAIVGLAKILKLPVAFLRIEGGYGVHPRWSDVVRKGKMRSYISKVIEPEEYLKMPDDELYALIKQELFVDERTLGGEFYHKKSAEYMERALYYCPDCGFSEFESDGAYIQCKKCGKKAKYLPNKTFEGVDGEFPYKDMCEWYDAQSAFVNAFDPFSATKTPLFEDTVKLFDVFPYKRKILRAKSTKLSLYGDRIVMQTPNERIELPFDKLSVATVLGKNKLNLYFEDKVYQCKGEKRFNALKYVNICYRYKNVAKGDENGEFLGL
ncbi:MAG: 1-acyl-sn-glycerol-3-phosphate acyltransferase [Clostridia bacterium]|nr:1-acyl-sn-glycerol-3-phosphate acyltransferase [Clostridia bacterium]